MTAEGSTGSTATVTAACRTRASWPQWSCASLPVATPDDGLDIDDITTTLAQTLTAAHNANLAP